ncbi:hypothetical protein [Patulibacter sp. SYSU D01012]|uniref:hypothetical protein n=1 Tax=Patulibacter sp. SYSU D01012 TaxID=2817381 RepID=UPI001B301D9E|nr:hypothetical protein [Patulibacter sp. SYSU D01012]
MRKLAIPTAAVAAMSFAAVAPSYAQTPGVSSNIDVTPKVTPNKAGTKKKPKSVNLDIKVKWSHTGPDGQNKPVMEKMEILFPKGSLYKGGSVPSCAISKMQGGNLPKDVCPKGSIVGSGSANAWADTVKTTAKFTLVNGGAKNVYLFTEMENPAIVQVPVPGKIKKGGKLGGYVLTLDVPDDLKIVGGAPISLIDAHIKTKSKNWLMTTSCPKNKKWPFETTAWFDNGNQAKFSSSVKCK